MRIYIIFLIVCLLQSCNTNPAKQNQAGTGVGDTLQVEYAAGFDIIRFNNYTEAVVYNPWDKGRVQQKYILIDRNKEMPADIPEGTVVKVPIQSVACYSAIQVSMLDKLNSMGIINAVAEPGYIANPAIHEGIASGKITDLGPAVSVAVEKLIASNPEIIIAVHFRNAGYGAVEKTGIPILECIDYMELSPLGQTEWIRFIAEFIGKQKEAEILFGEISERYNLLCEKTSGLTKKPTIFSEKKYGNSWYIACGQSVAAIGFAHAGAEYLWNDLAGTGSVPMSFESVYARAENADYWLFKYNLPDKKVLTYEELKSEYKPYEHFKAFKERKILACNTSSKPYYENGLLEPDVVLADLIHAIHPDILPDHEPVYIDFLK